MAAAAATAAGGSAARPVLPGAASSALAALLAGPRRPARLVWQGRLAYYLLVDEPAGADAGDPADPALVAVTAKAASRLPCAVRLAVPELPTVGLGQADGAGVGATVPATVGAGEVVVGSLVARVARWFPAAPVLGPVPAERLPPWRAGLRRALAERPGGLADPAGRAAVAALGEALRGGDPAAVGPAAAVLLGRGPGSTPAGDDVLAGALVTLRLLAPAHPGAAAVWAAAGEPLAGHVLRRAPATTTPLSAALLRHAARGEPLGELADVLRTLARRTAAEPALRRLLAVGHSSGVDLATGMLVAVDAAAGTAPESGSKTRGA